MISELYLEEIFIEENLGTLACSRTNEKLSHIKCSIETPLVKDQKKSSKKNNSSDENATLDVVKNKTKQNKAKR